MSTELRLPIILTYSALSSNFELTILISLNILCGCYGVPGLLPEPLFFIPPLDLETLPAAMVFGSIDHAMCCFYRDLF